MSGTKSFPADNVKLHIASAAAAPSGTMSVLMRTNKYYTDGNLLQTGVQYTVTKEWGQDALSRNWCEDVAGVFPETETPSGLTATQVAATQSLVSADGIPPVVAIMGDSIGQQNVLVASGTYYTQARGPVMWMLTHLGHPWEFQPSDSVAVAGTTLDVIIANQLPALLAQHVSRRYQRVFISAGTNDTNSARPIADIQADFLTLFRALRGAGIIPVHTGIRPRGIDGAITAAKQANMRLNEWLYQLSLSGLIEYIPVSEVYADTSTAFGNAVASLMYDGGTSALHPNAAGAALEGKVMADYYVARGVRPGLALATQQGDVFDRTNNPGGVAFASANPLLLGGTTAPTGMTTSGGTWSNVSRTLPNGQVRASRRCSLAAATTHFLYDDWTKTGPWLAADLQPGDVIEGRALVLLSSAANISAVQMRLAENNGATTLTHYAMANSESANLQGDHVLYLKTPRVPVRDYAGSGNVSIFGRADIVTGAGGTTATATASLASGAVSSVAVGAGGSGYVIPPAVILSGGGGFGATAVAIISGGTVAGIYVTSGGAGYSSAPTVTIAPPNGFSEVLAMEVRKVG